MGNDAIRNLNLATVRDTSLDLQVARRLEKDLDEDRERILRILGPEALRDWPESSCNWCGVNCRCAICDAAGNRFYCSTACCDEDQEFRLLHAGA